MDERRFDALTKALVAAKPSRREALRRLAGGALATVFGSLALKGTSAQGIGIQRRACGQRCDTNAECNAGLQCGAASEECFAIPSSKDNCSGNGDCDLDYETCNNNGRCVNTVAPKDCIECNKNGDCEVPVDPSDPRTVCKDHVCIERECSNNDDCSKQKRCRDGVCVRKN
jgi:hypothetical protein